MTTLEIVLIVALAYFVIAHIMNFISVACNCYLCDFEGLIANLFWVILLPIAIIRRFIKKY